LICSVRELEPGATIEADVCIIGGGAAGIVIARELIDSGLAVAVFESGGYRRDRTVQNLYAGECTGEPYPLPLDGCRTRRFGGSTNCWGGTCTPLNEIDYEQRSWVPWSGWPFPAGELDSYLRRAHRICCNGPYLYDESAWRAMGLFEQPFEPSLFTPFVWNVTNRDGVELRFSKRFRDELASARNTRVYLDANVIDLVPEAGGTVLRRIRLQTLDGRHYEARARSFVLACGGIENARLLLAMEARHFNGRPESLTGRFFHEHLQMPCGLLEVPAGSPAERYAKFGRAGTATFLAGLVVTPKAQAEHRTLNASIALEPYYEDQRGLASLKQVKLDLRSGTFTRETTRHLWNAARDVRRLLPDAWRRLAYGERPRGAANRFVVFGRSEQSPDPRSRVTLSRERDALGVPRAVLDWRTNALDRAAFRLLADLAAGEFHRTGWGEMAPAAWLEHGEWPPEMICGPHHMGTTRMSDDPSQGVVDRNCRMHSLEGLYVAGSSVFPTGGHATPTLTIVALAIRLAHHVRARLAGERIATVTQPTAVLQTSEPAVVRTQVSTCGN
jgi:choline dehydrogenase-like flavoprotein